MGDKAGALDELAANRNLALTKREGERERERERGGGREGGRERGREGERERATARVTTHLPNGLAPKVKGGWPIPDHSLQKWCASEEGVGIPGEACGPCETAPNADLGTHVEQLSAAPARECQSRVDRHGPCAKMPKLSR